MAPGSRLQELTAKYMQNPRRYFVPLANEYRKSNELDRAIALCREHLPSQPGHMSGHIVLGRAYFEKGDIEAAREVFMTSVSLDDENLIALRHLGDIARSRGNLVEARQWYVRVLDADPQNAEIERIVRGLGDAGDASAATDAAAALATAALAPASLPPAVVALPESQLLDVRAPDVAGVATVAHQVVVPASNPTDGDSALFDPTPPGLRAITAPTPDDIAGGSPTVLPPVPTRTLGTLDLSTLDQPLGATAAAPSLPGIEVDDGVGFMFDDVEALEDPAASGFAAGQSLPSVDEADFSAGVQTPTQSADSIPHEDPDPLLTRPAFGALASFASWRSAQDRDTPSQQPAQPPAGTVPPAPQPADPPEPEPISADASDLFWDAGTSESAPTAPEFVTETMAALYAQQGFLQQALNVYRALADRSPWDTSLHEKILGLEASLSVDTGDKSLEDDADKALQFGDLENTDAQDSDSSSMLEQMYDASPPARSDASADSEFGVAWNPDSDDARSPDEDWFAEEEGAAGSSESAYAGDAMFGISTDAFGQPAIPTPSRESVGDRTSASQTAGSLTAVFGSAASSSAADDTAAEVLIALAAQMVGRLPKEAPTLPVPDILELPSAVAADEATGASPAPLLSFDRFFSGSGAPPRQRIDTPATRGTSTPAFPSPAAPAAAPSLSPTFGGVPVIPPPPAAVTPTSWASFDQFVPPARTPAPTPSVAPSLATPLPEMIPVLPPALVPPRPVPPRPVPPRPAQLPGSPSAQPPYPSFSGLPLDSVAPPAPSDDSGSRAPEAPLSSPSADDQDKALPSEFHRWLEGLS